MVIELVHPLVGSEEMKKVLENWAREKKWVRERDNH